jgi:outer membrane protein assembly factor BamA
MKKSICLFLFLGFTLNTILAQNEKEKMHKTVQQQDVFYAFSRPSKKDSLAKKVRHVKPYKLYIAAFPFVGYNPALGFLGGITFNPAVYLGPIATTPISAFAIGATYTAKKQTMILARSNVFTKDAGWLLRGDWRLYFYTQPTYGLGSGITIKDTTFMNINTGGVGYAIDNTAEPMKFNYIRFYEAVYKKITGKFYLGMGYYLDKYYKINDQSLKLDTLPQLLTEHYEYSERNNINTEKYCISGISASFVIDERDNSIRPTKGMYVNFEMRFNPIFLGSTKNSTRIFAEFRKYVGLSKKNPAHLLAFWSINSFLTSGSEPYLALPSIGWDTYNRTGRGYVQGRIRGVDYMYAEMEYRFPISRYTRILSGVAFANISTASNDLNTKLFKFFDPAAGVGLRIMLNKNSLSNLTIDYGFGLDGSHGLFLNINETF